MFLAWVIGPLSGIGVGWMLALIGVGEFLGMIGVGIGWIPPAFFDINLKASRR